MTALESAGFDPLIFRRVFAAPGDPVVLATIGAGEVDPLRVVLAAVGAVRLRGRGPALLILGDVKAQAEANGIDIRGAAFLDPQAAPMIPAILAACDVLLALGRRSDELLSTHRNACGGVIAVRPRVSIGEHCGLGRRSYPWDGASAESLAALLEAILREWHGGQPPMSDGVPEGVPECPAVERTMASEHRVPPAGAGDVGTLDFVLKNDWGIGDELLLSAVAREIVRARSELRVWIRSRYGFSFAAPVRKGPAPGHARDVEVIYQNPTLYSPGAHSPFPGHLVQQMLDKFALDTGVRVIASNVTPELELPSLPDGARVGGPVLVHTRPNPRLPSKDWGFERWQALVKILRSQGLAVAQVGGADEPALDGVMDLRGTPVRELSDLFGRATGVVCVVGFLMHLAAATRTPALVIYGGREHPAIDGYRDQIHLSSGPLRCRGRWGCHLGPDLPCPHGMKCMDHLTPELVATEFLSRVSGRAELVPA